MPRSCGVIVFDYKTGEETIFPSYKAAARAIGVGPWIVRDAIVRHKTYPDILEKLEIGVCPIEDEYKPVRQLADKTMGKHNGRRGTKVNQLNPYTFEVIATFDQIKYAALAIAGDRDPLYVATNIQKCCSGRNQHAYGFKWEYVEGEITHD